MISDVNIFVDRDACFACGICVDRCGLDNLRLFVAPCRSACPIQMNCQGYVRLIAQGKEKEAAEEMRKYLPFSGILGRVCTHPCESACERASLGDGAVHIRALKRYLADAYPDIAGRLPAVAADTGKKVAVIGAGPSGMMAAYELRAKGHAVTVYEASSKPGGLMRWAIPSFRLPVSEVDSATDMLASMGIDFKTNAALGEDFTLEEVAGDHDAVLLAIGAGPSASPAFPGEDLDQVYHALDILESVKENKPIDPGDSAIIIGGGNSAADVALTLKKLGVVDVRIVCLENTDEMPLFDIERRELQEEGVIIENCWGPRSFTLNDSGKIEVEISKCLSVFDVDGSFCPQLEDTCQLGFEADSVVLAVGQKLNAKGIPAEMVADGKQLEVDPLTLKSASAKNVFCCGDAVTGPSSIVIALAQGREAAISIDRFVSGENLAWGRDRSAIDGHISEYEADHSRAVGGGRGILGRLPVNKRTIDAEIEASLTPEQARQEADRCLSCGRSAEYNKACWYCLPCEIECPTNALEVKLPYQVR